MFISDHFSDQEFGLVGITDQRMIDNAKFLATTVLEKIRDHFGPVTLHCGFRAPEHNAAAGGKSTSFHLFVGGRAAVDFHCANAGFHEVFDWIRLESGLPFDKVILEHNHAGDPRCVHIQTDRLGHQRREAYTGETGNAAHYIPFEVR